MPYKALNTFLNLLVFFTFFMFLDLSHAVSHTVHTGVHNLGHHNGSVLGQSLLRTNCGTKAALVASTTATINRAARLLMRHENMRRGTKQPTRGGARYTCHCGRASFEWAKRIKYMNTIVPMTREQCQENTTLKIWKMEDVHRTHLQQIMFFNSFGRVGVQEY